MPAPPDLLAGLVVGIDHIGVCVGDMDAHAGLWSGLLGLAVAHRECVDVQQTEAAFIDPPGGGATVELVSPLAGNAGLTKFLGKRGAGLHHLAFAVTDIAEALRRLDAAGVALIDREARRGARGHLVAFLHPKALGGTLVELVQREATRGEGP
jgi:methylmalonyl-CoA/ethylmalonyl-CoA epimerase